MSWPTGLSLQFALRFMERLLKLRGSNTATVKDLATRRCFGFGAMSFLMSVASGVMGVCLFCWAP